MARVRTGRLDHRRVAVEVHDVDPTMIVRPPRIPGAHEPVLFRSTTAKFAHGSGQAEHAVGQCRSHLNPVLMTQGQGLQPVLGALPRANPFQRTRRLRERSPESMG